MFCDRLLAAGGVALLLTGCGAKGPPRPPLSREPQAVRELFVRQSGSAIELRWSRPRARVNGDPIQGPMTFRVLARNLDRTPVTGPGSTLGGAPGATGPAGGAIVPGATGTAGVPNAPASPAAPAFSTAPGAPSASALARASEESFLRDSEVVAEIAETPEQAAAAAPSKGVATGATGAKRAKGAKAKAKATAKPGAESAGSRKPEKTAGSATPEETAGTPAPAPVPPEPPHPARPPETQYSALLGPERFAGTRFTSVRLAFAVVAQDASGRRSHARPILEIDPVETLPPPTELVATGTPEGVALAWRLPPAIPAPEPAAGTTPPPPSETRAVDIYRVEAATSSLGGAAAPSAPPSAARFPYRPIAGSPFAGQSALDRTAVIGTSYLYEARLVSLAPGKGLRESVASGTAAVAFTDVFPPGPPTLVTALLSEVDGKPVVRVAWSSPIEADVAGYRVVQGYGGRDDGRPTLEIAVPASQTEWTDTNVRPGHTYRYWVKSIDAADPPNESVLSEPAEVSIPREVP